MALSEQPPFRTFEKSFLPEDARPAFPAPLLHVACFPQLAYCQHCCSLQLIPGCRALKEPPKPAEPTETLKKLSNKESLPQIDPFRSFFGWTCQTCTKCCIEICRCFSCNIRTVQIVGILRAFTIINNSTSKETRVAA